MDFETALETQRLRLLRVIAGLVVLLGFLSVGPVSRGFSVWVCGFVASVLSRAETAARYLVIAHAYRIVAHSGFDVERSQISESFAPVFVAEDAEDSPAECQQRLKVLRAVLMDLPRHALRLLRRIEKQSRRAMGAGQPLPRFDVHLSALLCAWRLAGTRIERPPDDGLSASSSLLPPPGIPAGGVGGWCWKNERSGFRACCL